MGKVRTKYTYLERYAYTRTKWSSHGDYFPNRDKVALNYPDNLHESTAF